MTKANASLKATKAATIAPSNEVVTLSQAETIRLAALVASSYLMKTESTKTLADTCKAMFKAGVKLGKRKASGKSKACPIIAAFLAARFPDGKNKSGEPATDKQLSDCSGYFKRAVETGDTYSEGNAAKPKAGDTIMVAIKKSGTGAEAAGKLMGMINKMKDANSELAHIAAYLVDAIKDAGYEPANVAADAEIDAE